MVLFFTNICKAQNATDRDHIKKRSNLEELRKLQERFNENNNRLQKKAKTLGYKTKVYENGVAKMTLETIINGVPFYSSDDNLKAATSSKVDRIWNGGDSGLNLTGKDVIIGHWENSGLPLTSHVEFEGRVIHKESLSSSSHATHTAGTMIAKGLDTEARGMASEAKIHARNTENDEAEMASFAADGGILSNHSYGQSASSSLSTKYYGHYSESASEWDEIAYNAPYYLICKSAGNNRDNGYNVRDNGYDILLKKATAKNILVVGAVKDIAEYSGPQSVQQTDFSSYGPTDDFRIKPDLMANGHRVYSTNNGGNNSYDDKSGTSMATPVVTGTVALLQQLYHQKNNSYMKSATVKALLINSANELGEHPGPDFANGWGLLNAEEAATQITENENTSLILEEMIEDGASFTRSIEVDDELALSITLAWTDVPGTPISTDILEEDQSDRMLVNDLDIRITGNGEEYKPWTFQSTSSFTNGATKGDNFRDNVEKIEVPDIEPGTYTVSVTHKNNLEEDEQDFSLVINGVSEGSLSTGNLNSFLGKIKIYPNPSNGLVNIKIIDSSITLEKVEVYDVKGSMILKTKTYTDKEDVLRLPNAGIYFVKIVTKTKIFHQKIIVQ
ncbi:S8 family serine peptidase [Tenacibaculum sp. MAR_2009_124]|uniref:S8 family serine peptidase n=1 Tax=Tenacibaculum sp. MAR_2009_124 TaxID=1250059 RepID=UPI0015A04A93|nr:S8 family serine peptidase [Tenacibaculum sp. MAR_2009_124]